MSCPCGLSQERVLEVAEKHGVPLVGGLCQNPFTKSDGSLGICGKPLGDHRLAQASGGSTVTAAGAVTGNGDGAGLYYLKDNDVYDFWSAVVQPDAVTLDETGKKLTFKNGVTRWGWDRDVSELYIRECYTRAIGTLSTADMAMLEGTPGIGKSLFIFYFIYVMVHQARDKGNVLPTFLISDRDGTGYFLRVDSDGNGIVQKPTTELTPDYLITDTKGRSNPSFTKQYLHVSSINNVNVKDVRKLMDQAREKPRPTIFLPGFSSDEYFEIDGDNDPARQVAMTFYYDVFGGSLRNLRSVEHMGDSDPYPKGIFDVVQEEMVSFFGGYELAGIPVATWDKTARALAKKLRNPSEGAKSSRRVDPETITRSVIIHWTPSVEDPRAWLDLPATRFMRHLAGHICATANCDALSRLKTAIGPSGMGWVHEHDAHQFRLTHLRKKPGISLWSLQNKDAVKLYQPIKRVVRLRTVKDIERLEEGDYGLPTASNFPFLDAVVKPHYLFQDTIAQGRHPSVAKIPEILKALKKNTTGRGSVALINTLATDNFDTFKMNNSAVMKPFSQWKTRMEAHTDDVAAVTVLSVQTASEESNSRKRKQRSPTVEVQPKGKERKARNKK